MTSLVLRFYTLLVVATLLASLVLLPASVGATTLGGQLDVNGGLIITPTDIDFTNPVGSPTGKENIAATSTFTVGGVLVNACSNCVTAKDLNQVSFPVSGFTTPQDFSELPDQFPTINFQMKDILSCGEMGVGVTCALGAGAAFGFNQTGAGTLLSPFNTIMIFTTTGDVFDTVRPLQLTTFVAVYTLQFPTKTIDEVMFAFSPDCVPSSTQVCGSIGTSYSASKLVGAVIEQPAGVPEPATLLLVGTGLVGTTLRARKGRTPNV